jgi:hypothetical protein
MFSKVKKAFSRILGIKPQSGKPFKPRVRFEKEKGTLIFFWYEGVTKSIIEKFPVTVERALEQPHCLN